MNVINTCKTRIVYDRSTSVIPQAPIVISDYLIQKVCQNTIRMITLELNSFMKKNYLHVNASKKDKTPPPMKCNVIYKIPISQR